MKLTSLTITEAQALGGSDNVRLHFAEKHALGLIAIKPISVLTARFDPVTRDILTLSPSLLAGAVLTVEDSDYNGVKVQGIMEAFKKGDIYTLTEINSKVVKGEINPLTNEPYKVGEKAVTDTDGLTIRGNMNIKLHPSVVKSIQDEIKVQRIQMSIKEQMEKRLIGKPVVAVATNSVEIPIVEDEHINLIDDEINSNVEGNKEEEQTEKPKGKAK